MHIRGRANLDFYDDLSFFSANGTACLVAGVKLSKCQCPEKQKPVRKNEQAFIGVRLSGLIEIEAEFHHRPFRRLR